MDPIEDFKQAQRVLLERVGVEAESRFVRVDAISGRAHVLVSGEGPPVVMVPGFADPAAIWAPLMARLDGFTCYAVDRPSFGLTDPAKHRTATIRNLADEFLSEVLDALGLDQPQFVANSLGSTWTTWLALDRPERVRAMTHIGCPALILGTSAPAPMRLLGSRPLGALLMRLTPPSKKSVDAFARMVGVDLSVLPELRDLFVAAERLPGARASIRELIHALVYPWGPRSEVVLSASDLRQITQPVQLIWGDHDVFGGVEIAQRAAEVIDDSELTIIEGGHHVPWIDRPGEVGDLASSFLQRHAGEAPPREPAPTPEAAGRQ